MDLLVQCPVDATVCDGDHLMQELQLESPIATPTATAPPVRPSVLVHRRGKEHQLDCLMRTQVFDLRNDNTSYILPDLWLSGQTQVFIGRYSKKPANSADWRQGQKDAKGVFKAGDVGLRNMTKEVAAWVTANHTAIQKFSKILADVRTEAVRMAAGSELTSLSLVFEASNPGVLKLYPRTDDRTLVPSELAYLWASKA